MPKKQHFDMPSLAKCGFVTGATVCSVPTCIGINTPIHICLCTPVGNSTVCFYIGKTGG